MGLLTKGRAPAATASANPISKRVFANVADSFMRFMAAGIFVAHTVNLDYGFISHEYERLDRRFRFPKLCTVVGMRRCYLGHKSYGLRKLCELYGIELKTHLVKAIDWCEIIMIFPAR
jgi:DNA polymerase-3 subunit epsilon